MKFEAFLRSIIFLITAFVAGLVFSPSLVPAQNLSAFQKENAKSMTMENQITSEEIRPFKVSFPDDALADLRRRIVATKWPDREQVADDSQGVQLATMKKLADYWAQVYDWRKI
jgi:hypothetical protein